MRAAIETKNLSFKYSKTGPLVLNSIDMHIDRGRITAIAGLSGCGKSTLAFCLCGIIPKNLPGIMEGNILLDGKNIKHLSPVSLSQMIGIVFQEVDNQIFLPTVEAEIAFAPENLCLPYDEIGRTIDKILDTLRINHLRYKNPSKLSGGEKCLVAIASVLSLDPQIIILDEVLAELDHENRSLIIDAIRSLKKAGKTIVLIDHNSQNLMIADVILLMKDGKIEDRIEVDMDHEFLHHRLCDFFLYQSRYSF
jgi:energy-coupling factor transport system ATP-binding protein